MFVGTVHRCHLVCLSDMSVYQYVGMSVCQYVSDGMSVCQYAGMSITQRVPELLKAGAAGTCRSRFITVNLNHCDQIRRTSKINTRVVRLAQGQVSQQVRKFTYASIEQLIDGFADNVGGRRCLIPVVIVALSMCQCQFDSA